MLRSRLAGVSSPARLLPPTLAVWGLMAAYLLLREHAGVARGFGDSDDATRMTMVRDLLHGRGWYDQRLTRFQPPDGVYMHWSRLLDGALAAMARMLALGVGEARGELLTRLLWPLALIGPAVAAGLSITRGFAGEARLQPAAVLAAAAGCLAGLPLYAQFHPGRVDHHNVQLLLWLGAYAGAARDGPGVWGARLAGVAMGLGLAIGLEALPLHALIGGFLALRFVLRGEEAGRLRGFGLALLAATAGAFLLQTPPERWGVTACDALALNLTAALCVAGAGLAAASACAATGRWGRLGAVLAAGLAAILVYAELDPHCLHGPFAEVDPRIRPIWLAGVQEMTPLPALLRQDLPTGLTIALELAAGVLAWAVTGAVRGRWRTPAFWLGGLMLAGAAVSAWAMLRMSSYLFWAALAPLATAAAELVTWRAKRTEGAAPRPDPVRTAAVALVLTPAVLAAVALLGLRWLGSPAAAHPVHGAAAAKGPDRCLEADSYRQLAGLPPGTVLAEPDLGPFVVAYTAHAAVSAPYHRMAHGLLAGHAALSAPALSAPASGAAAAVRALHVDYVLECRAHAGVDDRPRAAASLQAELDADRPPGWLQRLSPPGAALQVYRPRAEGRAGD